MTGEKWHPCEIDPDEYGEDGIIEDTITWELGLIEDEDEEEE